MRQACRHLYGCLRGSLPVPLTARTPTSWGIPVAITAYDQDEFNAIRWLTDEQVLEESDKLLDPHMHRFTHKLQHARAGRHCG
ncbi:hypothetical protein [Streptomyces sp. NPDC093598]|uniref:hypothetical protein n=1 Tax=Streptomyces sp. NPDC093598 TaxID=3366046 RepID=UPI0037F5E508